MQAIQELARRGALPANLQPVYEEAVRRRLFEEPIKAYDWQSLADRVQGAENRALDAGPPDPEFIAQTRQAEARRQGEMFGATRDPAETVFRRATNTVGVGIPAYLEAATSGFGTGLSTAENHEFIKAADDARGARNPKSDLAGLGLGIVGQALALPGSAAQTIGARALPRFGLSTQRVAGNAAIAGGLSATEAGFESRGDIGEMAQAGAIGAGVGGAVAGAVERAAPLIQRAGDYLSTRSAKFAGIPKDQAAARVISAAEAAGLTPLTARAALRDLGPEAMIADVIGPAAQRMGRAAANNSPEAQRILEDAMQGRAAGAPERLMSAVSDAAGMSRPMTVEAVKEASLDNLRPAISEAYRLAREAGYDLPNSPFKNLMQSPMVKSALDRAETGTMNRVVAFGDGQNSRLAVWDATKRELDAIAEKARREGDRGLAGTAETLATKIRETVDEFVPEYGDARALRQSAYRGEEAVDLGAEAATRPAVDLPERILGAGPPRREVSQGYAAALTDRINRMRGTPGLTDSLFGSPGAQAGMRAALGGGADNVIKTIEAERAFARTQRGMTGNSTTARQLADLGMVPAAAGVGYLGGYDPIQAGGLAAALVAGRRGLNSILDARRAVKEEKIAPIIAALLTRQGIPIAPERLANGWERTQAAKLIEGGRNAVVPLAIAIQGGARD